MAKPRQRGKNTWEICVENGRSPKTGKRTRRYLRVRANSLKEAIRLQTQKQNELNQGGTLDRTGRLSVFLDYWFRTSVEGRLAYKTVRRYGDILRMHIIPGLGHIRLDQLKATDIKLHYQRAREQLKLGSPSIIYMHRVLHRALEVAVDDGLIMRNPASRIRDLPRPRKNAGKVLNVFDARRLLEAAEGTSTHLPVLMALGTGLRRGEICALRLQDIDIESSSVTVNYELQRVAGRLILKEPKSETSRRRVSLPGCTMDAIREQLRSHTNNEQISALGVSAFLCCWPDGRPLDPDWVTKAFSRLVKKAGVHKVRFHDLRHTNATWMMRVASLKSTSVHLGHSGTTITGDFYGHAEPAMDREAADFIDGLLRKQ